MLETLKIPVVVKVSQCERTLEPFEEIHIHTFSSHRHQNRDAVLWTLLFPDQNLDKLALYTAREQLAATALLVFMNILDQSMKLPQVIS